MRCIGCGAVGTGGGRCRSCGEVMPFPEETLVLQRPLALEVPLDRRQRDREGPRAEAPPSLALELAIDRRSVPRHAPAPIEENAEEEPSEELHRAEALAQHAARVLEPAFSAAVRAVTTRIQKSRDLGPELRQEAALLEAEGHGREAFDALGRSLLASPLDATPIRDLERLAQSLSRRADLARLYDELISLRPDHPSGAALRTRAEQLRILAEAAGEEEGGDSVPAAAGPHLRDTMPEAPAPAPAMAPAQTLGELEAPIRQAAGRSAETVAPGPAAEPAWATAREPLAPTMRSAPIARIAPAGPRTDAALAVPPAPAPRAEATQLVPPAATPLQGPGPAAPIAEEPLWTAGARRGPPPPPPEALDSASTSTPAHADLEAGPAPVALAEPAAAPRFVVDFAAEAAPLVPARPASQAPAREEPETTALSTVRSQALEEREEPRTERATWAFRRPVAPGLEPAPMPPRLLSWAVDGLLLCTLPFFFLAISIRDFYRPGLGLLDQLLYFGARHPPVFVSTGVLCLGTAFVYLTLCEAMGGRTLGDRVAGLRSIDPRSGRPPALGRAAARSAFAIAGTLAFLAGPLWALFDPRGQALHDRLAGTVTVRAWLVR